MLDKFNTEIAQCLGSMSHAQLEDICWEGAQYLLVGDWRSPSVSLVVGQDTKLDHIHDPVLVALRMEPLLDTWGLDAQLDCWPLTQRRR